MKNNTHLYAYSTVNTDHNQKLSRISENTQLISHKNLQQSTDSIFKATIKLATITIFVLENWYTNKSVKNSTTKQVQHI